MYTQAPLRLFALAFCAMALILSPLAEATPESVAETMTRLTERIREGRDEAALNALDNDTVLQALTEEERLVLATEHWTFTVNVPVVVSIVRHDEQKIVPFWLESEAFTKTDLVVKNELNTYEVWQKSFPTGKVGLGINGFERHRPHYFVAVGPQNPEDVVEISDLAPSPPAILPFSPGSFTYADWDELVLTEVPDALNGQILLTTIRGRAREAEIIGAFRSSPSVATDKADLTTLTWSDDPATTQAVQWRTATGVENSGVYTRKKGEEAWTFTEATSVLLEDRNILNNTRILWHTAEITGLDAGSEYEYAPGVKDTAPDQAASTFKTAPRETEQFSFLWVSDNHKRPDSVPLIEQARKFHPDAAFIAISGDLIGTGQHRDDWETLFTLYGDFITEIPLVPALGNHDTIDGLGSVMYRSLFRLPDNGPERLERGQSHSMEYGNLLQLVSVDSTDTIEGQTQWLEETLSSSQAPWKIVQFHFPPYAPDEDYPEIRSLWGDIFDKYHVDIVLTGHVHYYLRSFPMYGGQRVDSPAEGTLYLISVAVAGREKGEPAPDYAAVFRKDGVPTCQAFTLTPHTLTMNAYTAEGTVYDSFTLKK
ncbi:MAG: metallophosphoesterase [Candidatus Hydrogenedens sp.]|jgi:hypothetical protein|nr:metallophosphoesterase [Candidatus Hydrogenedens sp.]